MASETHQYSPRWQASIIMFPDGDKEASKMCSVLIGSQHEGPWHWKHLCRLQQPQRLCL